MKDVIWEICVWLALLAVALCGWWDSGRITALEKSAKAYREAVNERLAEHGEPPIEMKPKP